SHRRRAPMAAATRQGAARVEFRHLVEYTKPIRSAGCGATLWPSAGGETQGCLLRVQRCTVGRSQEVSSSVPPRTLRIVEPGLSARQTHEPHSEQTQRVVTRPLSAVRWIARGSPRMSWQASSGRTTAIENALLVLAVRAMAGV